jgi:hypothetical protein
MNKIRLMLLSMLAMIAPVSAFAVVPTYISDALTSAQTTFTDYLTAAAPSVFAMTIILAAFFLVVRLIKKATH